LWAEPSEMEELTSFFDKFLKEEDNGFEKHTPKVRTTVLRFGKNDPYYNIAEEDYPLPRTDYRKLYLNQSDSSLSEKAISGEVGIASHDSTSPKNFSSFDFKFDKTTRLVGLPKAVLYMSCDDADDMVVYVTLRKLDKDGKPLLALNIPWSNCPVEDLDTIPSKDKSNLNLAVGFMGVLRASHREIDDSKSMHPQYPFHPHQKVQPVKPGDIVKLEIGIWAMGVEFEAGESLRVQVSGGYPLLKEESFEEKKFTVEGVTDNTGMHKVHCGGEYESHVILPFV
jgi:predicted acyl esterase